MPASITIIGVSFPNLDIRSSTPPPRFRPLWQSSLNHLGSSLYSGHKYRSWRSPLTDCKPSAGVGVHGQSGETRVHPRPTAAALRRRLRRPNPGALRTPLKSRAADEAVKLDRVDIGADPIGAHFEGGVCVALADTSLYPRNWTSSSFPGQQWGQSDVPGIFSTESIPFPLLGPARKG